MGRLQQIKRSNGSIVSSLNLPKDAVDELGWSKGDELECTLIGDYEGGIKVRKIADGED